MKIGVFDSGVGGLSMANAIQRALPKHEILIRDDRAHVPYGTRSKEEIYQLVTPILLAMAADGCQVIVIACNTVSTLLITELRLAVPVPLVATEPMVKPAAAATKSGVIAVCATPGTLSSERYKWLKQAYCTDLTVLEPDCSDWSYMIEHNRIDDRKIHERVDACLQEGADVIVLGCTHYHWIEEEIRAMAAGRALVIQPEPAIIRRLRTILAGL